jgi:hypothetical protein
MAGLVSYCNALFRLFLTVIMWEKVRIMDEDNDDDATTLTFWLG